MSQSHVDFEDVKNLILAKTRDELEIYIRDKKSGEEALFLFWASENLERKFSELSENQKKHFIEQRDLLENAKFDIITNPLSSSLKKYSEEFVLGALEYSIRTREAQIRHFEEYSAILKKLRSWSELGFSSESLEKKWEKALEGIEEIEGWMKQRAEAFFPHVLPLINIETYQKLQKSEKKVLKSLRKGRSDNTVFQILTALLHSNPILIHQVEEFVKENETNIPPKELLLRTIILLEELTEDEKVKEYCQLIINHIEAEEN
ncbi:MAG: hypothetical protein ACTSW1_06905 [Candidatus Hodarchaeales archaeon]